MWLYDVMGERYFMMVGGMVLNCVVNLVLLCEGFFDDIWV